MRVTHTTNQLDITDGPGAVKLLSAYITYIRPMSTDGIIKSMIPLTFHGTSDFGETHKVSLTIDGLLTEVHDFDDKQRDCIGYRFDARLDGEPVEVEYFLRDPGYGRGHIRDKAVQTA